MNFSDKMGMAQLMGVSFGKSKTTGNGSTNAQTGAGSNFPTQNPGVASQVQPHVSFSTLQPGSYLQTTNTNLPASSAFNSFANLNPNDGERGNAFGSSASGGFSSFFSLASKNPVSFDAIQNNNQNAQMNFNTKTSIFGQPLDNSAVKGIFGGNSQGQESIFGQPSDTKSVFGQPPTAKSIFGQPSDTKSVFGQPPTAKSIFDQPSTAKSVFGGPAVAKSIFDQPSSGKSTGEPRQDANNAKVTGEQLRESHVSSFLGSTSEQPTGPKNTANLILKNIKSKENENHLRTSEPLLPILPSANSNDIPPKAKSSNHVHSEGDKIQKPATEDNYGENMMQCHRESFEAGSFTFGEIPDIPPPHEYT